MKFFFDNCISPKLARAIHALVEPEHQAIHLTPRFKANTPDIDWIRELAREQGWIVISGDMRIKKRPQEREVWKQSRLTTFFMADGFENQLAWEQVRWLIDKWPAIQQQAELVIAGSAFIVPKRGKALQPIPV